MGEKEWERQTIYIQLCLTTKFSKTTGVETMVREPSTARETYFAATATRIAVLARPFYRDGKYILLS